MREIGSMPFLTNLRPQATSLVKTVAPEQSEDVKGVDSGVLQQHLMAAKGLSTKDVLAKYDLRNISREELTALTNILHDRNEISERQFNSLFSQAGLAFPDSNTEKGDFLGFLESGLENFQYTSSSRQDGWRHDILTRALNTVQAIDRAKTTGADEIAFKVKV